MFNKIARSKFLSVSLVGIICVALFIIPKNIFASGPVGGCFPREDAYISIISKEPNLECLYVTPSREPCLPFLFLKIKNHCDHVLMYGDTELHNFDDARTVENISGYIELNNVPQEIGDEWNETLYYKDDPDKKVVLSFEVKAKFLSAYAEKTTDILQVAGINLWWYIVFLCFIVASITFFFLKKKNKI